MEPTLLQRRRLPRHLPGVRGRRGRRTVERALRSRAVEANMHGALTLDDAFRDTDGQVGFSFANREWPHGWNGSGLPHGVVFSR